MAAIAVPPRTTDLSAKLWSTPLPRSHGFEPLTVEGKLPPELRGTLYRNGPAVFSIGAHAYAHPFEGDGAVTAFRFDGTRVFGASHLTGSPELDEERAAGKPLYGLAASWARRLGNLLRRHDKNIANTSVMLWQDRLLAMVESSLPTELDAQTLARLGETDLGGVVRGAFSAHPHRVSARHAVYNFGIQQGRKPQLVAYELPDAGPARVVGTVPLAGACMLHDFIATERHLVWFVSPVRVAVSKLLFGDFPSLFQWKPELGVDVIVMPIDRPAELVRFQTGAFYQWHFANAFESGDEIVVDYVRYPSFDSFFAIGNALHGGPGDISQGRYHRARLSPSKRTFGSEAITDRPCEFPTIARGSEGREHGVAYLALGDLAAVGKLDPRTGALVTHELPASQRTTEPLFVARPGATSPDDGHVLALQHDEPTGRACLAIYDAARLPDGPVARAWFDHFVPITFHGTWRDGR